MGIIVSFAVEVGAYFHISTNNLCKLYSFLMNKYTGDDRLRFSPQILRVGLVYCGEGYRIFTANVVFCVEWSTTSAMLRTS